MRLITLHDHMNPTQETLVDADQISSVQPFGSGSAIEAGTAYRGSARDARASSETIAEGLNLIPDDGDGWATIEILEDLQSFTKLYHPGDRLRVPTSVAKAWIAKGKAKYVGNQNVEK